MTMSASTGRGQAVPSGALLVLCLPLAQQPSHSLVAIERPGLDAAPFLPSRARAGDGARRAWTWSESTLVAWRQERSTNSPALDFGHSAGTLADLAARGEQPEAQTSQQPGSCASLWHLPERGYVLVVEALLEGVPAEELDQLAADLREGHPTPGYFDDSPPRSTAERTVRKIAGPLLPAGPRSPVTLTGLLGGLPEGVQDAELHELLLPRPFAPRGLRHFEQLCVAVQAEADDSVEHLRDRDPHDFDNADRVQEEGYFWRWSPHALVEQPAGQDANKIAVREDGRAAFLNLEATSVHHDYVGIGGSDILLDALPLVAERASEDRDFWRVMEIVGALANAERPARTSAGASEPDERTRTLTAHVKELRAIRARITERTALYEILHAPEEFTTWTQAGQLSTLLRKAAGESAAAEATSPDVRSERALAAADHILSALLYESAQDRRQHEEDARKLQEQERQHREDQARLLQGLAYVASVAGTILAIVVLFTAIAAIPNDDGRAIDPLLRAAFITSAVGTVLMAALGGLVVALRRTLGISLAGGSWGWLGTGMLLLVGAIGLAAFGSMRPDAATGLGLVGAAALALVGAVVTVRTLVRGHGSSKSPRR